MQRKNAFLAAVSSLALGSGLSTSTAQQAALENNEQCKAILQMNNVEQLQSTLADLLQRDPNSPCVQIALAQITAFSQTAAGPETAAATDY